jgi:hypothetical protein
MIERLKVKVMTWINVKSFVVTQVEGPLIILLLLRSSFPVYLFEELKDQPSLTEFITVIKVVGKTIKLVNYLTDVNLQFLIHFWWKILYLFLVNAFTYITMHVVYNFTLNASMKVLIIFALKAYILQLKSKKVCLF